MEQILRDTRLALRGFRRTPTFPIAVVAILGVSVGMAVAMFTALRAILLDPLPVHDVGRIAIIAPFKNAGVELSPPATDLTQLRTELRTVSELAGAAHWGSFPSPYVDGDRTVTLHHAEVTSNFFEVLRTKPLLGRLLRGDDNIVGAPPTMVISYKTWRTYFGGDSSIVGRRVMWPYTRLTYTIVGVAPPGLDYPLGVECWTPMSRNDSRQVLLVARLSPNVSIKAVEQDVFRVSARMRPALELSGASAIPLRDAVVGSVQPAILATTASAVLLLMIASVNIGNLFLARATTRTRELVVRRALGASYGSIVRQLVTESMLLAIIGGGLGIAFAIVFLHALLRFAPSQLPRLDNLNVDFSLMTISLIVTMGTAIVFSVLPSLFAARDSGVVSASGGRSVTSGRRQVQLRDALVVVQVAIAVVLLAVGGLVSSSLISLQQAKLGYNAEQLAVVDFAWDTKKFSTEIQMTRWGTQMQQLLREAPGVSGVTPILIPPFLGESVWHTSIEAESGNADGLTRIDVPIEIGGAEYFETMGIPIQRGRGFTVADEDTTIRTVVISESTAGKLWQHADPIGKRIRVTVPGAPQQPWSTVVGVVQDTRFRTLRTTSSPVYLPWRKVQAWQGMFALRTSRNTADLTTLLQTTARNVDPSIVLGKLRTMDAALSVPLSTPRFTTLLIGVFGVIALFLASVGLYGVITATVREQTREIGIRAALGATPGRVFLTIVRHGVLMTSAGCAIGLLAAFATTYSLESLLYNITPTDPLMMTSAVVVLLVVATLAMCIPARRAATIDPVNALRGE